MLWYKSWLDTRLRFGVAVGVLLCSAAAIVLAYPRVMALMPLVPAEDNGTELVRRIRENALLARTFRGYIWSQWFGQNLLQLWTVFAAILGIGGLVTHGSRGALFTLSLPVSRRRLVGVRAAAGFVELIVVAFVPVRALPLFAPAVGQHYAIGDALGHGVCVFAAGASVFAFALLMSTSFEDLWRPLMITIAAAVTIALVTSNVPPLAPYSPFTLMSGETFFRTGRLPWIAIMVSAAVSAAMVHAATVNLARRDF